MASVPSIFSTTYARLAQEYLKARPLLPTYVHLLVSAVFPIFTAAYASLRRPTSAAAPTRTKSSKKVDETGTDETEASDEDDEPSSPVEALSTSDAVLFPILAGATLTGLYLIIKWLEDPAILNKILGYYFSWVGTFFTFRFLRDVLRQLRNFAYPLYYSSRGSIFKAEVQRSRFTTEGSGSDDNNDEPKAAGNKSLYWKPRDYFHDKAVCVIATRKPLTASRTKFSIDRLDLLAALMSATVAILTVTLKKVPWYLTNLSGFAFSYGSLQFMSPGSSATGSLLLSLLFIYDIYMVFYTPMMVTVATKLDVPIKLLFPRPADTICPVPDVTSAGVQEIEEYAKCLRKQKTMAMLGLGDIVVPGILIAFALRFDLYNYYLKLAKKSKTGNADGLTLEKDKEGKPIYRPARGMWAERLYTARALWPNILKAKDFPKPYFHATMIGYIAGLVTTLGVMQVYQHAQPALLYLVPGVLLAFWGQALWRGEVSLLWQYDETTEEKKEEKDNEEKDNEEKEKESKKTVEEEKVQRSSTTKPAISFDVYLPRRLDQQKLDKSD